MQGIAIHPPHCQM